MQDVEVAMTNRFSRNLCFVLGFCSALGIEAYMFGNGVRISSGPPELTKTPRLSKWEVIPLKPHLRRKL